LESDCWVKEAQIKTNLKRWLMDWSRPGGVSIVQAQIQQATARIVFGIAGLGYLYLFSPNADLYRIYFVPLAGFYLLIALLSIPAIRQRPISTLRTLAGPVLDIAIVCFAMLLSGGHASGLYFMLLIIIFGNGLRWGNAMLVYTQALSILGLLVVSITTLTHMQLDLDRTLLFWQLTALIVIPLYVYLIGNQAERATREKQQSEETSFQLLDQGPMPVFTFDLDEHEMPRIHYANNAINRVAHDDLTRLVGERPDILTLPDDAHEMLEFCRRTMLTVSKEPHLIYVRGKNKQGEALQLMCSASRIRWHNRWLGICFILDITRIESLRHQLEEAQSQSFMSTLLGGIIHDFRNVMTNIIGSAEVMQMETSDDTLKQKLEKIIASGERGTELVKRLLPYRGKPSNPGPADAQPKLTRTSLENAIGLARMRLRPDIQLHCNIEDHLPDVTANSVDIEQILLNLIQNSITAIKSSGLIDVTVWRDARHELAKPGHPSLGIRVTDNGCGIAPENIPHIFEPFWSSWPESGGKGLGLAMVKKNVDMLGGKLDVKSRPGHGTTFTIHIPPAAVNNAVEPAQVTAPASPRPQPREQESVSPATVKSCRILLVDDAPDVLSIHQAMLQRLKHEIISASNGQQALELFQSSSTPFDLVITDYRMPKMTGVELAGAIRAIDASIPILIISAYGEEEQLRNAAAKGIRVLNKPVSLNKLEQTISRIISG